MVKSGVQRKHRALNFENGKASRYERCMRLFDFGKPLELSLRRGRQPSSN